MHGLDSLDPVDDLGGRPISTEMRRPSFFHVPG